jgi:hypothetical protein
MCALSAVKVVYGMAETKGRRKAMEDSTSICEEHWLEDLRIGDDTVSVDFLFWVSAMDTPSQQLCFL